MLGSIHLSRSEAPFAPAGAPSHFDLTVEGLDEPQARSTMAFAQNLMLGFPTPPPAVFPGNPLEALTSDAQKSLAIFIQTFDSMRHNKIVAIKHVRRIVPTASLREAKEFVDYAITCRFGGSFHEEFLSADSTIRPHWVRF
jgi:hypothetical protein